MKDTAGYIYVIKSLNLYKIGRSSDSKKRIKLYKTYNPHGIETVFAVRVRKHRKCEKYLHSLFKHKRMPKSEWFFLDEWDLLSIETTLHENNTDPFKDYPEISGKIM